MPTAYDAAMARRVDFEPRSYDAARLQLYGVGIGLGMDPRDEAQLAFLLEDRLTAIPSFASVAGWNVEFTLGLGMAWPKLIHASERVRILSPLPPEASILVSTRCASAWDKPARNATLLVNETTLAAAADRTPLAVLESVYLARGFRLDGAPEGRPDPLPPTPDGAHDGPPDITVDLPVSPQAALVYRLLGGRSFIHCDPRTARAEGFDGPILHGLALWGHACHAVLKGACGYDPARLRAFAADFSAPVYPGEILTTEIWRAGETAHFRTRVRARDTTVLSNGTATIKD